jgi:amino-acid N-acetyltransferase
MNNPTRNSMTIRSAPSGSEISYRSATPADVPAMTALLESAGLPSRLIEPYLETFLVAEADGVVLACGGLEVHGDTAVLRSVVVDESLRGSGVGRRLSLRLIGLAMVYRVRDIYLFTAEAWAFWKKVGFVDTTLEAWRLPARASWQFDYVKSHQEWAESVGLRTMWMPALS